MGNAEGLARDAGEDDMSNPTCQCGCTVYYDGLWRHVALGPDGHQFGDEADHYRACPTSVSGYCVECGDELPVAIASLIVQIMREKMICRYI